MDRTGRCISLLLLTLVALPGETRAATALFDIDIRELDREKPAAAPMKVTRISRTAGKAKKGGARAKKKGTAAVNSNYLRYTVKPGDTIYKILMARLGMTNDEADRLIPEISRINKISNIRKLRVGQTLLIPVPEKGKKGATAPQPAAGMPSAPVVTAPGEPGAPAPPASATGAPPPGAGATETPAPSAPGPAAPTTAAPAPAPAAPGGAAQQTPPSPEPAGEKAEPEGVTPEQAQPEEVPPEQAEPEKVEPEKVEPEKVEHEKVEPEKVEPEKVEPEKVESEKVEHENGGPEKGQPEAEPSAQGAGKAEPGKAQPERPQSEEDARENGQSNAAPEGNAAPPAAAPGGATPGAAAVGAAPPGGATPGAEAGAAAPETAAAPAAPAFVPPLVCSITYKDPAKIVEAVLNALSIPSTANKVIESEQGAETYGVKADRYFEYKGGRYIVSIGDSDPYNYTMIRLLEKAGYRVLVLGAADDFTVVAEKVLRLVGIPYDYSRNLLPGVNQAATGYLVQQGGVAGGRRVLITRDQVDSRQQWAMKPGCVPK